MGLGTNHLHVQYLQGFMISNKTPRQKFIPDSAHAALILSMFSANGRFKYTTSSLRIVLRERARYHIFNHESPRYNRPPIVERAFDPDFPQ